MIIRLIFLVSLIYSPALYAYEMPTGIPKPNFGIDEIRPAAPPEWPEAERAGYYYIDNSDPNATDSDNEFGYPDRPRATIPSSFRNWSAGTYIEVHGGVYEIGSDQWRITASGTRENPIWLVGDPDNPPTFRFELIIESSSYLIVEHLKFDTHRRWIRTSGTSNHLSIRNCELSGDTTVVDRTAMIGVGGVATGRTTDVVVFRNTIHSSGDRSGRSEVDVNGIVNPAYTDRVWILENHVFHLGGDSVRTGQNESRMPEPSAIPHLTYIGGNHFHDNGENAIDVKHSADVIISGNVMHGFLPVVSSSGEAVVVHENARNIWMIGNQVFDSAIGLINTGGLDVWYIGNEIYNIHANGGFDPTSTYGTGVAMHFRGISSGGAVGNTVYNSDKGLQITSGGDYVVANNIFAQRAEAMSFDVMFGNTSLGNSTDFRNNLFTDFRGSNGSIVSTNISSFQSDLALASSNLEGNPSFLNAEAANFSIQNASDALDSGADVDAYDLFQSRYGIDIRRDFLGRNRPLLNGWDIGSREFAEGKTPKSPESLN